MIGYDRTGAGEPLVLLHGLGSDRHIWRPVVARLALEREVFALDLPGFGNSPVLEPPTQPTPRALAEAVAALLDDLGIDRAHFVGNSLGGWVAVEAAKLGRARSLVLISPAGLWKRDAPLSARLLLRANRAAAGRVPGLSRLLRGPVGRTLLLWPFFGRPWRMPGDEAVAAMHSFGRCPGFVPTYHAASNQRLTGARDLGIPVTVAFGSRDWLLPRGLARYRGELPGDAARPPLPGCGHTPTYDDPERIAALILAGSAAP